VPRLFCAVVVLFASMAGILSGPLVAASPPPSAALPAAAAPASGVPAAVADAAKPTASAELPPPAANETSAAASQPPSAPPSQPAADPKPEQPPAERSLTRPQVDEQIQVVRSATSIDDATKAELLKRYQAAIEWLTNAEEAASRTAQYEAEIKQAPELLQQVKQQLALPASAPQIADSPGVKLKQMEQELSHAEAQLKDAGALLSKQEEALKRRGERKAELAKLVDEAKERIAELKKQLVAPPPRGEAELLTAARRMEYEARRQGINNQLSQLGAEAKRLDARAELLPLERDLAKRDKARREKEVAQRRQLVTARRKAESQRQAREARRQAEQAHPAFRQIADGNTALAEQRQKLADSIARVSDKVSENQKQLASLAQVLTEMKDKLRYAGHSTTVGLILRKQRGKLASAAQSSAQLRFVDREMPKANLERMELEDARGDLGDLDAAARSAVAALAPADATLMGDTVRDLLVTKRDLLDKLMVDYDTYIVKLSGMELSQRKLRAKTKEVTSYVDEHVLWIRSAEPLGWRDAIGAWRGMLELARPSRSLALARQCVLDAWQQPYYAFATLMAAVLLIAFRGRLVTQLKGHCAQSSGASALKFRPTLAALVLAAAIAAQWPLILAYLGWRMTMLNPSPDLARALGMGLQYAMLLLWVSQFTNVICSPGSLAESHFGWSAYGLRIARRHLRWLTLLVVPLAFLAVAAEIYQEGQWNDSLGRISFLLAMLALAAFMHAILHSKDNVLREILARYPNGWLARLRPVVYLLAVGVPCLLAVLACIGYYFSAQQLAFRLQGTLALVLAVLLAHALVDRWLLVKRRNLAIGQLRQRQAQNAEAVSAGSSTPLSATEQPEESNLSELHSQAQYLLRHAAAACVLVGSWLIWAHVLPALNVLDNHVLWWNTVQVTQLHVDADGTKTPQRIEKDVATTLRHVLVAVLLLGATVVLCRNLPALLEITLWQRLLIDRGGRHAISVIVGYLVVLTGVVLAFRMLSISWSSVQWLAAGMTVGLGFGLQEVFANFISGIILLFERPIRVGDIVTLGDVTGTVTNIRIRATTVTNWDRKELIVPNKDLITGRLLNWTLSNATNRVVIHVGLAYQTDAHNAHELLLAVAHEHPNVLRDPAPNVTFESFGDSTLDFVLRCYLASMDVRLSTIHDLHAAIHRTLADHDIEIAFPQRDINVRSVVPAALAMEPMRPRPADAA
jgi:potassium efflux system protein